MITAVCVFMLAQFGGTNPIGDFLYYLLIMPFFADFFISGVNTAQQIRGSATVTEIIDEHEENFI